MSIELPPRPAWHEQAACRGTDPSLFYPEKGDPTDEAKAVCAECPVAIECFLGGLDEQYGIWGGGTLEDRRATRRERARSEQVSA